MTAKPVFVGWLRGLLFATAFVLIFVGAVLLAFTWRQNRRAQMRATDLPITVRQAKPIITAIKRYRLERSALPPSLSVLVPQYLPRIPDAGPVALDGWHYNHEAETEHDDWTLSVRVLDQYSPNLMGFGDTFAFHPSGRYPRAAYGGIFVPFGRWGYYVE